MVQAWFLISLILICNAMMMSVFSTSTCRDYFQCGDLGLFGFPFFNNSYRSCGLCMVDCDAQPSPKLRLGMRGKWYDIKSSLRENSIDLQDPMLQIHLDNRSCEVFTNISLPKTPSISFSINLNLTVFKCSKDQVLKDYFAGYMLYDSCEHFNLYYMNNLQYDLAYLDSLSRNITIPSNCIAIELPTFHDNNLLDKNSSDLFQLLSSEFSLEWHLSHECYECHLKRGQCQSDRNQQFRCANAEKGELVKIVAAAASVGGFAILVILAYCFRRFSFYRFMDVLMRKTEKSQNIEDLVKNYGSLASKRYRYSDVKKMTNSFKIKLGQGGYGSVYKGKLHDCTPVAVKVLKESKGSGEEFINEVASISKTSHVNIVNLLGFCSEGRKRALIYEFMPNGSLDKFIYGGKSSTNRQLRVRKLYKISVGIARGLEYLHSGCNTRILHFDIKPHNILLDRDFTPKISDFGLAKLCHSKESIVSIPGARGTVGYIAPEVFCKNFGGVSYKSDVYSYGMMIFEMVGGRNIDVEVDHTSEIYFPDWIYRKIDQGDNLGLDGITNEEEDELARKMIIVSLWCIQTDPSNRPSMTKVVEMLEGSHQALQIPPKPFLFSPSGASECVWTVNMT